MKHFIKIACILALLCLVAKAAEQDSELSGQQTQPQEVPELSIKETLIKMGQNIDQYYIEIALLFLVVVYISNYFLGKATNAKVAAHWVQENKEVFEQNFSLLGVSNIQGGALIDQESANLFRFYASGRINCVYAMTTLELKKRQDLLSSLILSIVWPEKDKVSIEIPIDVKVATPITLAIVRKREAKKVYENSPDLKSLCRKMKYESLINDWVIFGEYEETTDFLLSNAVISLLNKNKDKIQMLSITDQRAPQCDMLLPSNFMKESKDFTPILKALFYLVDQVTTYKMSQQVRTKAEKERVFLESNRSKEDSERRNEELQQQKLKAEEDKIKGMSKEQLKKYEEKKQEKEQKKRLKSKYVKIQ